MGLMGSNEITSDVLRNRQCRKFTENSFVPVKNAVNATIIAVYQHKREKSTKEQHG